MANVHYLQHVAFEGLGSMEPALLELGHRVSATRLYLGEELPDIDAVDWLIIMGGPMGIADENRHPWLLAEKAFIKQTIQAGKTVLGICLGAQLIANALGAKVYPNPHREIGWFPLTRAPEANETAIGACLPESAPVFHWHGDTFDLPANATLLASSEACVNQGFVWGDRVIALQFHLETTPASALALIEHCGDELDQSRFVQGTEEMLQNPQAFNATNAVMAKLVRVLSADL